MDIIEQLLSLAPVPYLSAAFSIFKIIWQTVEQVQDSKEQLRVLAYSVGQLLYTLDREFRAGRLKESRTFGPIENLRRYEEIT